MFKVTAEPKFTHTVKVQVPVDGGYKEQSFKATFRVLAVDELSGGEEDEAGQQVSTLRKVICDFDDLVGEDDQPLSYSDELRDKLISVPYVRIALMQTYLKAITKVRAGN